MAAAAEPAGLVAALRPPSWLVVATGALTAAVLVMAVAETSLWMHYLIDAGESISLAGLAFIAVAGLYLSLRQRLRPALPLTLPWLLFPIITQGDQIIDNLSINWMRLIVHLLLALIFFMPVGIVVAAARYRSSRRPTRQRAALIAALLFALELWVAVRFLGLLMVITLLAMIAVTLAYGLLRPSPETTDRLRRGEKRARLALVAGILLSAGLFFGFKNRPGAYQGSPAAYMDPAQQSAAFQLDRILVPSGPVVEPPDPGAVSRALSGYAAALQELLAGYYILDRNYNYDFHNRLFLRDTPLLPGYREAGLRRVVSARRLLTIAEGNYRAIRGSVGDGDAIAALMDDVRAYAQYSFARASTLERMSGEFEKTEAGLQHATHLYEGEGKMLGVQLNALLQKHQAALSAAAALSATTEFARTSREIYDAYANRIVGF